MTATTVILAAFSPLIVALVRREDWSPILVDLLSLLVVTAFYILGRWFDGALLWPLIPSFWEGLMAAFGAQQLIYKTVLRGSAPLRELERL